ncbi:hypothetical protein HY639_00595 [Candidatus Woesearchaeota archaeon]|nr:hypothetical protein [Candidatus Woesearchaeota archaeon]
MTYALLTPTPKQWLDKCNIPDYARRQAESCLYLEKLFARIEKEHQELHDLFTYLLNVHKRQYDDLAQAIDVTYPENRRSFYFEQLYAAAGIALDGISYISDDILSILAIQAVSYLRGHDRYRLLKEDASVQNTPYRWIWNCFYQDAGKNAEMVFETIRRLYGPTGDQRIHEIIAYEDMVIHRIWRKHHVIGP